MKACVRAVTTRKARACRARAPRPARVRACFETLLGFAAWLGALACGTSLAGCASQVPSAGASPSQFERVNVERKFVGASGALLALATTRFECVGAERKFLGPVGLHNVSFSVEVGPGDNGKEIAIYPPGIVMVGERAVVSKDPERHFRFAIDGRSYFLRKGSDVYVFAPEPSGAVKLRFHGLPVTLVDSPERAIVLVLRKEGDGEELIHGESILVYDNARFLVDGGTQIPADWRARGVSMPREGGVTGL